MISNAICKLNTGTINVPVIVRADIDEWVPTFDLWKTTVSKETSYIDCTQNFGTKLKNYIHTPINSEIGYYSPDGKLVIHWKAIIDTGDISLVHAAFNGKLRGINWQKRYCTYFNTGSRTPWLHSVILNHSTKGQVVHHINGVSVDNRKQNLHILPKIEHDSIDHPKLYERKMMFADPEAYWKQRRALAIDKFINELNLIIVKEYQKDFISKFAGSNIELAKEILELAKMYINLNNIHSQLSYNRLLNAHLNKDYLDAYEIEKYLKQNVPVSSTENQLRLL